MTFVRFINPGIRTTPRLSIWSRGQIGINNAAINEFNLNSFSYAVLYFDKVNSKIGVSFTNDKSEPGAIPLRKASGGYRVISAVSFIKMNKINNSKTQKYPLLLDKDSSLYVSKIKK